MGLTPRFNKDYVNRIVEGRMRRIEAAIIQMLQFLGERCIDQARTYGSYKDRTGNLRSSVGYIVVANGKIVKRNFEGDKIGAKEGSRLATEIAKNYVSGYVLIVVAGMKYAAYVESRGYDVLTSAELLAEQELPGLLKKLQINIAA